MKLDKTKPVGTENQLALVLNEMYLKQIKNFFGDNNKALKFLSGVRAAVQKNPKLLECTAESVINSFMTMAQLELMPSDVSGEAYVLPYDNNKKVGDKYVKIKEAQFQLGYQGHITLLYGAGVQSVVCEIVRANDKFSFVNGKINHEIDIFKSNEERGAPVGAYMIATVNDQQICKAMNAKDIIKMGERYSKSYKSDYSPWKASNDLELWMWKKTVLKQGSKMCPKNEKLNLALNLDTVADSTLEKVESLVEGSDLKMGKLLKGAEKNEETKSNSKKKKPVEEPGLKTIDIDADSEESREGSEG